MKNIYIYGLGQGYYCLDKCLRKDNINVVAYIDNYKDAEEFEGKKVIRADKINSEYDYIVISLMNYEDVRNGLIESGISTGKIISFFSIQDIKDERNWDVIDVYKWRCELMWKEYSEVIMPSIENYPYEMYADKNKKERKIPRIEPAEKIVDLICEKKASLARFGDNEFELILGRRRTNYQEVNADLGIKLKQVLNSNNNNLLIAIADNYGDLSEYTDIAALAIRQYLGNGVRQEHMKLLDLSRTYYDAYISRPYYMYRNKEDAINKFQNVKRIWDKRDLLIVEGEHTRFGVGNDLLDNANEINRILTLDKDCYKLYDKVLSCAKKYADNKLILIILGPVATIMSYDLSNEGYWAVDIGQLDIEYEWYLRKVEKRCDIPYKTVSEVIKYDEIKTDDNCEYIKKYRKEIVEFVLE